MPLVSAGVVVPTARRSIYPFAVGVEGRRIGSLVKMQTPWKTISRIENGLALDKSFNFIIPPVIAFLSEV